MTPWQARRVLEARRRRIARIRKTVATLSIAIFVALFSTIYVQMATGRDPVLGSQTSATKAASNTGSTSQSTSEESSSSDQFSPGVDFGSPPSSTGTPSPPVTPMTTSQS